MQKSWLRLISLYPRSHVLRPLRPLGLLGLIVLLGGTQPVLAQSAYQLEVAVADKGASEQKQAYQVAMRRVLLNNSADKTLLNRDDVRAGIVNAETYVESFSYRSPEAGTVISRATPITDLVRRTGEATQLMMVAFNPARIQALISASIEEDDKEEAPDGLANIRAALAWILVQDGRTDLLVGGSVGGSVQQRAREIAGGSGITLTFPAGDQTDIAALTSDQLLAKDTQSIGALAARYSSPAIVAAYLSRKRSRGWIGSWSKLAGEESEHRQIEAETLDDMLSQGIGWLQAGSGGGNYEYGGGAPTSSEGLVWVSSVSATQDYAKVMAFLNSIDSIATVFPKEVSPNGTLFAVMPRNALNAVASSAATTNWLRRSSPPAGTGLSSQAELAFDFLRQ